MAESNIVEFPDKNPPISLRERLRPESKELNITVDNNPFDPSYIFFLGAAKQNLIQLKTLEDGRIKPVVKRKEAGHIKELYHIALDTDFFRLMNFVKQGDMTNLVEFLKKYTFQNVNKEEKIIKSLDVERILLTTYENWDGVVRSDDKENPYDELTAKKIKNKFEHAIEELRSQEVLPYASKEILARSEDFFNSVVEMHENSNKDYLRSRSKRKY